MHTAALPQVSLSRENTPRPDPESTAPPFGKDTPHAIALGVASAVRGLAHELIDLYAALPAGTVMTGGALPGPGSDISALCRTAGSIRPEPIPNWLRRGVVVNDLPERAAWPARLLPSPTRGADGRRVGHDRRRWDLPKQWQHWEVPFDTDPDYPADLKQAVEGYRAAWRAKRRYEHRRDAGEGDAIAVDQRVQVDRGGTIERDSGDDVVVA